MFVENKFVLIQKYLECMHTMDLENIRGQCVFWKTYVMDFNTPSFCTKMNLNFHFIFSMNFSKSPSRTKSLFTF